ncbi:MAG: 50S ribosomal protein L11 methyltransferase [Pseudomonadota bacterium]
MPWQQLTLTLGALDADAAEASLLSSGAVAITYTDAADQPILEPAPGEVPMWSDAILTALFPESLSFENIALQLLQDLQLDALPDINVALLADREWEREWLSAFKPMQFGRKLWVYPKHIEVDHDDAVIVRLDPGLAFGTGTHATTALCLAQLEIAITKGARVLDFGCGSGILGIAALLLGAAHVTAVDIDPQAMTATKENARANDVSANLTTGDPTTLQQGSPVFDVVVANILAQPLIDLAPQLIGFLMPAGTLLLSGILERQANDVIAAYAAHVEFEPISRHDGWVMLNGRRLDVD